MVSNPTRVLTIRTLNPTHRARTVDPALLVVVDEGAGGAAFFYGVEVALHALYPELKLVSGREGEDGRGGKEDDEEGDGGGRKRGKEEGVVPLSSQSDW